MIARSALVTLRRWRPESQPQRQLRDDVVTYLETCPDACSRTGRPDHLTASALVVDPSTSRVLLGLHRKVGMWLQFGGHLETGDATLASAALREATEESGIPDLRLLGPDPLQLDRHAAPCAADARNHLDVQWLAVAPDGATPRVSDESLDVQWFDATDLPTPTDDALRRLVARALANR